jgi:Mrp family chromosome partitioning ATPase
LVTSTKQDEGKSFLIISLAYSLSLIQKKILIIDTNFKNNTLTRMLVATPKFDRLLESNYKERKLLKSVTTEDDGDFAFEEEARRNSYNKSIISLTSLKNIDIRGSKGVNESPAEILSGRNFKEALEEISSGYDYIFMEGASLNEYSDTKELVEFADVVLPVFSAQSSIKQLDQESISYLKGLDGKLMGAVLNKVNIPDMEN